MKAGIEYETLRPGQSVIVGDATITTSEMSHPVTDFGYRVDCNGKSVFFTGDHEPYSNIYEPTDDGYAEYQSIMSERQAELDLAMQSVDVLIVDSSYTREEFEGKKGWGHGHFDSSIEMAIRVGAKRLYCTHHEPTRSDDELEAVFAEALARHESKLNGLSVHLAREGLELEL